MMTSPRLGRGEKSALLEPMMRSIFPARILLHAAFLADAVRRLWMTQIRSGGRSSWKRRMQCSVRRISGTRRMADLPDATVCAINSAYTSVFPLAVTPKSSDGRRSSRRDCATSFCTGVRPGHAISEGTGVCIFSFLTSMRRVPFFSRFLSVVSEQPVASRSADTSIPVFP